ncbi:MAG: DUF488 domain-containing protein [Ignavibacteriae bacterium]|nr:DUF488 domain-containing protein [Ignavibacteriota bacterium]
MIKVKRIYDQAQKNDGFRILVDRLWPRGVSKETASVDLWLRDIAPSDGLRKWFCHDPAKWSEFGNRYTRELKRQPDALKQIKRIEKENGVVTLLYAAKDKEHNNAVALTKILQKQRG